MAGRGREAYHRQRLLVAGCWLLFAVMVQNGNGKQPKQSANDSVCKTCQHSSSFSDDCNSDDDDAKDVEEDVEQRKERQKAMLELRAERW